LQVKWDEARSEIRIKTEKPVKGLVFEEREGVLINDSAIDVVPGDEQVVKVRHFHGETALSYRYLGDDQ
jgi:beta-mannosidase